MTNASTDPELYEIAVKEERLPEVKTEMEMDMMPFELEVHAISTNEAQIGSLKKEKSNLINELVALKAKNQTVHLQVHTQKRVFDEQKAEIIENKKNIADLKKELEQHKAQIVENVKKKSALKREKNDLSSKLKQMQQVASNIESKNNEHNSTDGLWSRKYFETRNSKKAATLSSEMKKFVGQRKRHELPKNSAKLHEEAETWVNFAHFSDYSAIYVKSR